MTIHAHVFVAYSSRPEENQELASTVHDRISRLRSVAPHLIPKPEDAGEGISRRTIDVFEKSHIFLPVVSSEGRFSSSGLNQELGYAAKKIRVEGEENIWILPFLDVADTGLGLLDITLDRDELIGIIAGSENFDEIDEDEKIFEVIKSLAGRLEEMELHDDTWIIQDRCEECGHNINTNAMKFDRLDAIRDESKLTVFCDGCGSRYSLDPLTFDAVLESGAESPGIDTD